MLNPKSHFLPKGVLVLSFLIIMSVSVVPLSAQDVSRLPAKSAPFNEESWQKATEKVSYEDKRVREQFESQQKRINIKDYYKKPKEEPKPAKDFKMPGSELGGTFFKFFCIVLGIGLVGLLAYHFTGSVGASDKKITSEGLESAISEMEDNLPEVDIETPLEKAIRLGEYKIAIRMYFLLIMQKLMQKNFVQWRKDKTNRAYISELRQQPFLPLFMSVTLAYEKAWFGEKNIDKAEFEQHQQAFEQLKNII